MSRGGWKSKRPLLPNRSNCGMRRRGKSPVAVVVVDMFDDEGRLSDGPTAASQRKSWTTRDLRQQLKPHSKVSTPPMVEEEDEPPRKQSAPLAALFESSSSPASSLFRTTTQARKQRNDVASGRCASSNINTHAVTAVPSSVIDCFTEDEDEARSESSSNVSKALRGTASRSEDSKSKKESEKVKHSFSQKQQQQQQCHLRRVVTGDEEETCRRLRSAVGVADVVTEESSGLDRSNSSSISSTAIRRAAGTSTRNTTTTTTCSPTKTQKNGNRGFHKKRTFVKHTSMRTKVSRRSHLQRELLAFQNEGLVSSTAFQQQHVEVDAAAEIPELSNARINKRVRVAPDFYKPRADTVAAKTKTTTRAARTSAFIHFPSNSTKADNADTSTALETRSPPRQKRKRVATAFYKPTDKEPTALETLKQQRMTVNDGSRHKNADDSPSASVAETIDRPLTLSGQAANRKNRRCHQRLFYVDSKTVTTAQCNNRRSVRFTEDAETEADLENKSPLLERDETSSIAAKRKYSLRHAVVPPKVQAEPALDGTESLSISAYTKQRPRRAFVQSVLLVGADPQDNTTSDPTELVTMIPRNHLLRSSRNLDESSKKKAAETPLSHAILLTRYEELVAEGRCELVNFGKTLTSVKAAVDRKIKTLEKKCAEDIEDLEVVADLREYKRSLRSFSVYEDREKLALAQEKQEDMESWCRKAASKRIKSNTDNTGQRELSSRKIVFLDKARLPSRNNKCVVGPQCGLCCGVAEKQTTASSASAYRALIPSIREIDLDAVDESCDDSSYSDEPEPKRCRSMNGHPSSKEAFGDGVMDNTKATLMALLELKHSIAFVEDYNQSYTAFASI